MDANAEPTWLDEVVSRIKDDKTRADFLRGWQKLKRSNENDETLQLIYFLGIMTSIMQDIPAEALRLARELPKDPILDKLESTRQGWTILLHQMKDPEVSKRIDSLQKIMGSVERFGRGMEIRLLLAIAFPSFIAGGFVLWFCLYLAAQR